MQLPLVKQFSKSRDMYKIDFTNKMHFVQHNIQYNTLGYYIYTLFMGTIVIVQNYSFLRWAIVFINKL